MGLGKTIDSARTIEKRISFVLKWFILVVLCVMFVPVIVELYRIKRTIDDVKESTDKLISNIKDVATSIF